MSKNKVNDGFDSMVLGIDEPMNEQPMETAETNVPTSRKGLQQGLTRTTYILPIELNNKIKNIASNNGVAINVTVRTLLERAVSLYEEKNGAVSAELDERKLDLGF